MATTNNLYPNLTFSAGVTRLPGIRRRVFAIPKKGITAWPTRPAASTATAGALVKYVGSFTLADGTYFTTIDIVQKKSKTSYESQGEYPCKTFLNKGEFFFPGLEAEVLEFVAQANNDDMVFIVQESNGTYKVIGNETFQTEVTISGDSGSSPTDAVGETITVQCTDITPPMIYEGEIDLSDTVTIDCATK